MDKAPATACDEIIDLIVAGKSPEQIDAFRPSEETLARVSHLIELAKANALNSEERTQLEDFLQLEHLMIVAKKLAPAVTVSRDGREIRAAPRRKTSRHLLWILPPRRA